MRWAKNRVKLNTPISLSAVRRLAHRVYDSLSPPFILITVATAYPGSQRPACQRAAPSSCAWLQFRLDACVSPVMCQRPVAQCKQDELKVRVVSLLLASTPLACWLRSSVPSSPVHRLRSGLAGDVVARSCQYYTCHCRSRPVCCCLISRNFTFQHDANERSCGLGTRPLTTGHSLPSVIPRGGATTMSQSKTANIHRTAVLTYAMNCTFHSFMLKIVIKVGLYTIHSSTV